MKIVGAIMWAVGFIVYMCSLHFAGEISPDAWMCVFTAALGVITFVFGIKLFNEN